MGTIRDPTRFSEHFKVDPRALTAARAVDPTLNVDLPPFIDPLLLPRSAVPEMQSAATRLREHFEKLVMLLVSTKAIDDAPWKEARRLLTFHEFPGTGLGYSAATIKGSGFGPQTTENVLHTAAEIVRLGVQDPSLFLLLPLLEPGIGSDLISDMVTNIILPDLASYTERVLRDHSLSRSPLVIDLRPVMLPRNPCYEDTPVILLCKANVNPDNIKRHMRKVHGQHM